MFQWCFNMPLGKVRLAASSSIGVSLDPWSNRLRLNQMWGTGEHNSTIRFNPHSDGYVCESSVVDDERPSQGAGGGLRGLDENRSVGNCSVNNSLCTGSLRHARLESEYIQKGSLCTWVSPVKPPVDMLNPIYTKISELNLLWFKVVIYLTVVELDILVRPA